jgi:hypothetical protein
LRDRSVVTVGRGAGDLALEVARRGAARVVALDMAPRRLLLARVRLDESPEALPVALQPYDGPDPADGPFDIVLASDAFRAYGSLVAGHLESRLERMISLMADDGQLAIAMGPFWKAPFGGGGDSRLPWAHLIFPEDVVFEQFRAQRPGSEARTFADVGINRITLVRFERALAATRLVPEALDANVGTGAGMRVARQLARRGPLREYLTQNLFGVWRRARPGRP